MFNLQMFGSNDTVTSTNALQVEFGFSDEDTRIVTLQNARADIEASEVSALDAWVADNNIVVGDRAQADTTGINYVNHVVTTKRQLDLS